MPDTTSDENRLTSGSTATSDVPETPDLSDGVHATQAAHRMPPASDSADTVTSNSRFWLGIAVGAVFTAPLAWLLAHAATLPFFIGLFFFALFGLIIGAVVHRVASPGRPYARSAVFVGTTVLVVGGWMVSIGVEARELPMDLAVDVPNRTLDLRGRTRAEFVEMVASGIQTYLNENYSPGGTLGYARWVLSSGEFPKGSIEGVGRTLRVPQRKGWWVMRVMLSIGLFAFGVSSQTFLLRLARDPAAVRASELDTDDSRGNS